MYTYVDSWSIEARLDPVSMQTAQMIRKLASVARVRATHLRNMNERAQQIVDIHAQLRWPQARARARARAPPRRPSPQIDTDVVQDAACAVVRGVQGLTSFASSIPTTPTHEFAVFQEELRKRCRAVQQVMLAFKRRYKEVDWTGPARETTLNSTTRQLVEVTRVAGKLRAKLIVALHENAHLQAQLRSNKIMNTIKLE